MKGSFLFTPLLPLLTGGGMRGPFSYSEVSQNEVASRFILLTDVELREGDGNENNTQNKSRNRMNEWASCLQVHFRWSTQLLWMGTRWPCKYKCTYDQVRFCEYAVKPPPSQLSKSFWSWNSAKAPSRLKSWLPAIRMLYFQPEFCAHDGIFE